MTPCEKLGYKVGDKFEVVAEHYAFPRGAIITLTIDDGSEAPIFKGERTDNETSGCCLLFKVKPVSQRTAKPISKSKRQLAQLLIEAGVTQFPEGANWAAQDKCNPMEGRVTGVTMYSSKPTKPIVGGKWWNHGGNVGSSIAFIKSAVTLIPNWHQTVLSRAEFDQIVAEAVVPDEPTAAPTLDQLLQDWRNADDYAQRKQAEADEAAAMRDERWQAVQARAGEMGVTVGRCEPVVVDEAPVPDITDWRDLRVGDLIKVIGFSDTNGTERRTELLNADSCTVVVADGIDVQIEVTHKSSKYCNGWCLHGFVDTHWRFIRRP